MEKIRQLMFFFYRFFSNTKYYGDIALFTARATVTAFFFLHLLTILLMFRWFDYIPINSTDARGKMKVKVFLIMLPIYLLLSIIVRKRHFIELKEQHRDDTPGMIKRANRQLLAYGIISFLIPMVLALIFRT
jgi:hypothetical protein